MKLSDALEILGRDLNDSTYTTWQAEQLVGYLAEGVQLFSTKVPGLLAETVVMRVEPCGVTTGCGCDQIVKVNGQSNELGFIKYPLYEIENDPSMVWPGGSQCPVSNPKNFRLREYTILDDGNSIRFNPAPPVGADVYVSVQCVPEFDVDRLLADGAIPDKAVPAAIQWALFRAKDVDAENNPVIYAVAQDHRKAFWEIVADQERADDKKELKRRGLWPGGRRR